MLAIVFNLLYVLLLLLIIIIIVIIWCGGCVWTGLRDGKHHLRRRLSVPPRRSDIAVITVRSTTVTNVMRYNVNCMYQSLFVLHLCNENGILFFISTYVKL